MVRSKQRLVAFEASPSRLVSRPGICRRSLRGETKTKKKKNRTKGSVCMDPAAAAAAERLTCFDCMGRGGRPAGGRAGCEQPKVEGIDVVHIRTVPPDLQYTC